jgi:hypothetical protein
MTTELRKRLDGTAVVVPRKTVADLRAEAADEFEDLIGGMSREELLACKATLEDEMASIRNQLDHARVQRQLTGQYADADWYRRASAALRLKGRDAQRIQIRLAALRAERAAEHERKNEGELVAFVRAAKLLLDEQTYRRLWEEVNRSVCSES